MQSLNHLGKTSKTKLRTWIVLHTCLYKLQCMTEHSITYKLGGQWIWYLPIGMMQIVQLIQFAYINPLRPSDTYMCRQPRLSLVQIMAHDAHHLFCAKPLWKPIMEYCQLDLWKQTTNFNEISIKIHTFSFKKIHFKLSFGKWQPFYLSLNVLIHWAFGKPNGITDLGQYQGNHGFVALVIWCNQAITETNASSSSAWSCGIHSGKQEILMISIV